jgi:endonuclease-3 related protein
MTTSSLRENTKVHISFKEKIHTLYHGLYRVFGPQNWWPGDSPFEIMVGAILTQNTRWENVRRTLTEIKQEGLLSPHDLLRHGRRIPRLIRRSGFYNVKSKRLIAFLKYFVESYKGDTALMQRKTCSALRRELLKVEGIGRETADCILLYALSYPVFVIDAYTRRIFSRHGFFAYNTPYDELQNLFHDNLPRDVKVYNEYHALLVLLGKGYCKKNEPRCAVCPVRDTVALS